MVTDNIKNIAIAVGVLVVLSQVRKLTADPLLDSYEGQINDANLSFAMPVYSEVAEALELAFWEIWWLENENAVVEIMKGMQTTDDVLKLMLIYGQRCRPALLCEPETLYYSIVNYLEPEQIEEINLDYSDKGITVTF